MLKSSSNKKIKNATITEYNGIQFRSQLELRAYKVLTQAGLAVSYEPEPVKLLEGWKSEIKRFIKGKWETSKIRDWTYTPDFIVSNKDKTIFIEMKGFGNDQLPLKRKMFLHYLEENYSPEEVEYWEIYKITELKQLINEI